MRKSSPVGLDQIPEVRVERDLRVEGTHLGQHCFMRCAQLGGIADGLEMLHETPRLIKFTRGFFETEDDGVKVHPSTVLLDDGIDGLLRTLERKLDVGDHVIRGQRGPADVEILGEERVSHGGRPW